MLDFTSLSSVDIVSHTRNEFQCVFHVASHTFTHSEHNYVHSVIYAMLQKVLHDKTWCQLPLAGLATTGHRLVAILELHVAVFELFTYRHK